MPASASGRGRPRIAIAGFQHETNCFTPIPTTLQDFLQEDSWPGLTAGKEMFGTFLGCNIPIGGFMRRAGLEAKLVPVLWASAEPSNLVTSEAFETISARILEGISAAMPVDGIYLDLHGAMVSECFEDGEGELLRRVRELVGTGIPVAASLDLHANITAEMARSADLLTAYRTYPHLDMAETGARTANLLLDTITMGRLPQAAFRKPPLLVPLHCQCTDVDPARSLYRSLPADGGLEGCTADIAFGFPPSDIYQCGPAIVAYALSQDAAECLAGRLERDFLAAAPGFAAELHGPEEAIRLATEASLAGRPVVLADVQDNSGAGATSDTTALLVALAESGIRETAIAAVFDPAAVAAAMQAGIDSKLRLVLGGKAGGVDNPGFSGTFRVAALSDGVFGYTGAMMKGVKAHLGPTAALEHVDSGVQAVVTSKRTQCLDQALFTHLGIQPSQLRIVAVKSTVHFRADFELIASRIILVEAPGCNPCRLRTIPYRQLRPGVAFLQ